MSSRSSTTESLDQLVKIGLELGPATSGDVVQVVLGQETVAEQSEDSLDYYHTSVILTYLCGLKANMTYF